MTIDQRLESLAQRLEGLTQSVELIAQMQVKTEKEIRTLGRFVRTIVLDHESRLPVPEKSDGENDQ